MQALHTRALDSAPIHHLSCLTRSTPYGSGYRSRIRCVLGSAQGRGARRLRRHATPLLRLYGTPLSQKERWGAARARQRTQRGRLEMRGTAAATAPPVPARRREKSPQQHITKNEI